MAIKNYSAAAETLIQLSGGKENLYNGRKLRDPCPHPVQRPVQGGQKGHRRDGRCAERD